MSITGDDQHSRRLETVASISDNEAEFWTCSSHFDFKSDDRLEFAFKENLAKQADEVAQAAEKKSTTDIFQFDDNMLINENIPGVDMSFLDRLVHQLTRPSIKNHDDFSDEEFTIIDASEITSVINESIIDEKQCEKAKQQENSLINLFRSFFEEVQEETSVIFGALQLDSLLHRRSQQAQSQTSDVI